MKNQRMKKHTGDPKTRRQRLLAALSLLLISAIVLTASTFAWLVLSVAPEITGITTNIGSNGSLEIALLDSTTRQDLSLIRTGVNDSLVNDKVKGNYFWGNLIDLSDESFGLGEITLYPTRLNATAKTNGEGYVVDSGLLSIPTYGYDGRIKSLTNDTMSATFSTDKDFSGLMSQQDYGVRAIGTSNSLSVQGSALTNAKSNITTYTNSATDAAIAAMNSNGDALFNLIFSRAMDANATYSDAELDTLEKMLNDLDGSADYIDLTLRQGLIAFAASGIGDEDTFELVRTQILNTGFSLNSLMQAMSESVEVPGTFEDWVTSLTDIQNRIKHAKNEIELLRQSEETAYTWEQITAILNQLMDTRHVYFNDTLLSNLSKDDINDILANPNKTLILGPQSGIFASIADFTDNYETSIQASGMDMIVNVRTTVDTPYLLALASATASLEAADGSTEGDTVVRLHATYGYALDLAFRCNAPVSDLLLQTDGIQRVYDDSEAAASAGGGSYMEFGIGDTDMTQMQILRLIDAMRVGFIDDQGNLLGVAKLNTSNYAMEEDSVRAPLYLYQYEIDENGVMVMDERRKSDNVLTPLDRNIAKAITVVVWLDGDIVDNTMVSATKDLSLSGMLNLQFASSADLVPAENTALKEVTSDRKDLQTFLTEYKKTYEEGQGLYTTVSWKSFATAYVHATEVNENNRATELEIFQAQKRLVTAKGELAQVTHDTLTGMIADIRQFVGQTEDVARIVLKDAAGRYYGLDTFTEQQADAAVATIYRVDYSNNLNDEGNDVKTPIYTDNSWSALAAALYEAEILNMDLKATSDEIDNAITALDLAYMTLQRRVFYIPYDMNDVLYYYAISPETDTYGKWYDAHFKRIVQDITIIELDSTAKLADIAPIDNEYVDGAENVFEASVRLNTGMYPTLHSETILAVHWDEAVSGVYTRGRTDEQCALLSQWHAWTKEWLKAPSDESRIDEVTALGTELEEICEYVYASGTAEMRVYDEETNTYKNTVAPYKATSSRDYETTFDHAEVLLATANALFDTLYPNQRMTDDQRETLELATNHARSSEKYSEIESGYENGEWYSRYKNKALRDAVSKAMTMVNKDIPVVSGEADQALATLNAEMKAVGLAEVSAEDLPMTADQTAWLTASVNAAKSVETYESNSTLKSAVAAIEALQEKSGVTRKEADAALTAMNAALVGAGRAEVSEEDFAMTSGQRIMLTAASNSAKTVTDYDNAEKKELDALRAATAEAERILASESVITYATANAALKTLNAELKKAGKPEVTEYNTVAYQVPVGSEQFEIAYESDANVIMYAYDNCDDAELSAVVLTHNGVLCTTTKKVDFYHPAYVGMRSQLTVIDRDSNEDGFTLWIDSDGDGVKDKEQWTYTYQDEDEKDVVISLDGNLAVNTKGTISVSFDDTFRNENNSVTVTKRYHHDEHIQFVTWSTSDSTIAKVDPDMNDPTTATVTAQKEGLVDILVTVKTEEGRTRTYSRTIYVYTIPKAPAQQPTP